MQIFDEMSLFLSLFLQFMALNPILFNIFLNYFKIKAHDQHLSILIVPVNNRDFYFYKEFRKTKELKNHEFRITNIELRA